MAFADINKLVRKNILDLKPYSSARDEFQGDADVYLDANENPYPSPYNRYPDPLQRKVKERLAKIKAVDPSQVFLGNGSDEAIDLLIRAFCEPHVDSILITEPTYGMYAVCAGVNAVEVQRVALTGDFDIDLPAVEESIRPSTKLIFLCSPNNPTGNLLDRARIIALLRNFRGLVVIDEAYIDFARTPGFTTDLREFPNLVVLQTFSKAWGLAGLRLGIAFASPEIISILNKIKYPYNISIKTQELALVSLEQESKKDHWVSEILKERERLIKQLEVLRIVQNIYRSDSNFILVRVQDAAFTYRYLAEKGIIVRDRSNVRLCNSCLRITVGTPQENKKLTETLEQL
jgi:histidinol-phosphate aminotransferase